MRLLVDSHALLWWLAGDERLSTGARSEIESPESQVLVSAAAVWEIEIKRAAKRLRAPSDLLSVLERLGVGLIPITAQHAVAAARLPAHHADPFDRMIVAQARLDGLTLVTRDTRMSMYDVPILPA
jgi:PIN domain nuclease of toxin-antitoxin system